MNRLVARYKDGRMIKGRSTDFSPNKESFTMMAPDDIESTTQVVLEHLKALFFVRGFVGDPAYDPSKGFQKTPPGAGLKLRVRFEDGEVLLGTTHAYHEDEAGFFLTPADPDANTIRVFVVNSSVAEVEEIG